MPDITKLVHLKENNNSSLDSHASQMILEDEKVLKVYSTIRDSFILTDKRIILIDVQGITGIKKEFRFIPYSKINSFSVESAGTFDLDAELKLYVSGMPMLEIEFTKGTNIYDIAKIIGTYSK